MTNKRKANYSVVREDLHSNTVSIVASFGDNDREAKKFLESCSEYAERNCLPYVYSIQTK